MKYSNSFKGFSLVELSIVLVILGLLVGGVLGGQSLIHAAKLRSVLTDYDKYLVAINAFRGKYNAMPGDMSNATDYWGAAHATHSTCVSTQVTGAPTCNGDGNGMVANMEDYTGGNLYESWRAWHHLANAGLINGGLTGIAVTSNYAVPGRNIPESKIKGMGFQLQSNASTGYIPWMYPAGTDKHYFELGGNDNASGYYYNGQPILPVEDAYAIDGKVDDGKPASGMIKTLVQWGSCYAGSAPNQTYGIGTPQNCTLLWKLGF